MRDRVFYVTLCVGTVMLLDISWVFFEQQTLDTGGMVFTVCALLLVGMSVWRKIDVSVSEKGIEAKMEQVEAEVQTAREQSTSAEKEAQRAHEVVKSLKHSLTVRDAQTSLAKHGLNVMVDGRVGPETSEALKVFQAAEGLEANGELDEVTLEKLGVDLL